MKSAFSLLNMPKQSIEKSLVSRIYFSISNIDSLELCDTSVFCMINPELQEFVSWSSLYTQLRFWTQAHDHDWFIDRKLFPMTVHENH